MNKRLRFFSKLYKSDGEGNNIEELNSDCGLLLDPVCESWFGDKNKGLAQYSHEPLCNYVEYIQYHYAKGGYIEFNVLLGVSKDTVVEGKTIEDHVKEFISGQISDGWGENGLYIVESGWIGDNATVCQAETDLIDYLEYSKLNPDPYFVGMENGIGGLNQRSDAN